MRFLASSSKHLVATKCSVVCLVMVNLTLAKKSSKSQAYGLSQMTNPPTPDEFLQIRRCWGWSENGGKLAFGEHYEQVKIAK